MSITRIKISEHFYLDEFIHPDIYAARGAASIELIDKKIIQIAEFVRTRFNKPVVINNWAANGVAMADALKSSGLRPFNSTVGAFYSQHKYGRAVDLHLSMNYEELRNDIRKNYPLYYAACGITTIEKDTPTWLHADCRQTNKSVLYEVPFQ